MTVDPKHLGHFTHRNESFTCENCQQLVPPRVSSCRNHCPFCLTSKHVDLNPGDRANSCLGLMRAVGYELGKKGLVLVFRCQRCGMTGRNIAATDDPKAPDDYDLILKLSHKIP